MPSLPLPRSRGARAITAGLVASAAIAGGIQVADAGPGDPTTTTKIKHVVVLFQENTSFDHDFGTYPNAVNGPGEVPFHAAAGTPAADTLTPALLTANPNSGNPKRLGPADVVPTIGCGNNHGYSAEQKAFAGGAMNAFVQNTQGGGCGATGVMNYYDGNTVTGLWNYAQHFAMSDSFHGTGFGPSTIGAIQTVSGNTSGAVDDTGAPKASDGNVDNGTIFQNADPYPDYDGCSAAGGYAMSSNANPSKNIGDLLNTGGGSGSVSWGWFQGGFDPTSRSAPSGTYPVLGKPACGSHHLNVAGADIGDYSPHHNPFAYYKSTSNKEHLPPTPGVPIGDDDPSGANHQYDETVFDAAVAAGHLPAVSFVKAGQYQDGHPGYSDPIDEQKHLVETINAIEASPDWASTAIFIAWDDSDGWYDHQAPDIVRGSNSAEDFYSANGQCQPTSGPAVPQKTARCGFGPRLPFLVISPWAKSNYIDHAKTDQSSIIKFIEDNWNLGSIGPDSTDSAAVSINNMFDFTGAAGKNTALTLNPATGALPGVVASPTLTPTPTPTPAPGATPTPKSTVVPTPTPAPSPKPTLPPGLTGVSCKGKLSGSKKIVLACSAKKSVVPKTAVRARVLSGTKQLGTASVTVKGSTKTKKVKFTITIKTSKKVKKGSYTLSLSVITVGSDATATSGKLKL